MKLKLDLHPIFNDSQKIEAALHAVIEEAITRHASEVEIIPGKGSGALKKSVLRFLDRPDIKSRYHRLEKDSDNWGRLFLHFRHERSEPSAKTTAPRSTATVNTPCACCTEPIAVAEPEEENMDPITVACPWCGSPNRLSFRRDRRNTVHARAELDYGDMT